MGYTTLANSTDLFRQTAETLGMAKAIYDPKNSTKFDIHGDSQEAQLARRSGHYQVDDNTSQGEAADDQKAKEKRMAEEARATSDIYEEISEDLSESMEASAGADWFGDLNDAENLITKTYEDITETVEAGANAVLDAGQDALDYADGIISDGYHATVKAGGQAIDYVDNTISDGYYAAKSWLFGLDKAPQTAKLDAANEDPNKLMGDGSNVKLKDGASLTSSFTGAAAGDNENNVPEQDVAPTPVATQRMKLSAGAPAV